MKKVLMRVAMVGLLGLVLAPPHATHAEVDDDGDHDRARDLYEHGEIESLSKIMSVVHAQVPGDIVAVDFIRIDDTWVYRFQVVASDGRRRIVDVDAGAGAVMHGKHGD
ncbi:PepSY domain-containing protein [Mesorhizobium sp. Cs1321R2N1]|uniref:PepSY domain-containing protein n=1 Tax=Mesorhizobium sp. Cs1321R2N1 TaxID=3015174 RepID=UPI00301D004E